MGLIKHLLKNDFTIRKIIALLILVFSVFLTSFVFYGWQILNAPNIRVNDTEYRLYIDKHTTFKGLQKQLYKDRVVNDLISFSFLAKLTSLDEYIKPGMYLLKPNMSNIKLIRLLHSGRQTPIKLVLKHARYVDELPAKISKYFMFDEEEMTKYLLNDTIPKHYGFDSLNFIVMFIPNTYEFYWTSTPKEIIDKLHREYNRFWNEERLGKARKQNLTPREVSILASIIEKETNKYDETPKIASVYLNRLRNEMPLQADPTLVFATKKFNIRRVLKKHTKIESPYNTYINKGLPPGPICMPSTHCLEAVLNPEETDFLFFCAKDDFSGYHVFAKDLKEHRKNAIKFRKALNKRKIYK